MKLDNLNKWLTLTANVGVMAGIIFLAVELNQNAVGQKVSAKQEMTRQFSDYVDMLLHNNELRAINDKGFAGEEMTPDEAAQWRLMLQKATWYFASMHYQYVSQSLSEDEWRQSGNLIASYCDADGYKTWWERRRGNYSTDFVRYVDRLCEQ
jgi:hypothetical protein